MEEQTDEESNFQVGSVKIRLNKGAAGNQLITMRQGNDIIAFGVENLNNIVARLVELGLLTVPLTVPQKRALLASRIRDAGIPASVRDPAEFTEEHVWKTPSVRAVVCADTLTIHEMRELLKCINEFFKDLEVVIR
jgi:hypothetical protein